MLTKKQFDKALAEAEKIITVNSAEDVRKHVRGLSAIVVEGHMRHNGYYFCILENVKTAFIAPK